MLPMSAFELGNPVIFCVGMVADNLSFHVNMIARAQPKVFRRQASKTSTSRPRLAGSRSNSARPTPGLTISQELNGQ